MQASHAGDLNSTFGVRTLIANCLGLRPSTPWLETSLQQFTRCARALGKNGTHLLESARSVAVSYKPPMLVTRVRLPACAFDLPCEGRRLDVMQLCGVGASAARLMCILRPLLRWDTL